MIYDNWRNVSVPSHTIFDSLNKNLTQLQQKHINSFPNLRLSQNLLLGSDYSGESSDAPYLVFSFIITSIEFWAKWEPMRLKIRKEIFSDSRRISFKSLGDNQKKRALIPILEAANSLEGLSFSVAINKKSKLFFSENASLDLGNPDFEPYRKWKRDVLEKAFIIVNFLGFLLAGLSKTGQNVLWFTDEDNIAANDQRISELTNLFAWICNEYIKFPLGHLRCGTSRCDNGTRQIEDFLAIPDLIGGALSEQLKLKSGESPEFSGVFWMNRGDFSDKTRTITWWFSSCNFPLKRMICLVDPAKEGTGDIISFFHFHNQC